ncbi:ribosome silencing factor [Polaromonas glacialis]|uniref:ribosome silencing factor n=1 Tax=Polaromonas glacialis TaxID=866564 RepID=UPI000496A5EF|nr:ribosome silencing factor [Polaromonas glacialis]
MTPITVKISSAEGKKDVQKLQRAIIDGLEDVKAQDIQVFDTEHITSLFERVIVASGTSNRQTKALAASVRDAVRDAGFAKPRIEGEDNGEWIIVDCGAAVAHIMQPTIRQYYNLEELWGDKPIKLKLGAPAPLPKAAKAEAKAEVKPARSRAAAGGKSKTTPKPSKAAKSPSDENLPDAITFARTDDGTYVGRVGKTHDWTAKRNATAPAAEPEAKPVKARKPAARVASAESKPVATKAAVKKVVVKTPVVKTPVAKKVAAQQAVVKTAAKKPAPRKPAAKKTTPRSE